MDANYYDYLTQLPTMTYFFETSTTRKESIKKKSRFTCNSLYHPSRFKILQSKKRLPGRK